MTGSAPPAAFSLVDELWIPVLDTAGKRREASLLELFDQAGDIRSIACELPTQTFAILRLALAVLHRVTGGPPGTAGWKALWKDRKLPLADIDEYLAEFHDRFDLFHPERPFYQVADLRAAKDADFGLERLIADVPNGTKFLTSRAGAGLESITPADAARWLVHAQAFDPSGIKTGAVGDPRVTGGKGYPIGVGSVGFLGGAYVEGDSLLETLLLNLVPVEAGWQLADERDLPVWEREPQSATVEPPATRGPFGLLSLYTWQSRRIRLFGDRDGVTGAMISNGDPLEWQDRHQLEPMTVWGRSAPREKLQKRVPVYLPRPHDHTRALWRGLHTLLPPPPSGTEPAQRLSPMVLRWLARLSVSGVIGPQVKVRQRAASVAYGSKSAVTDDIFGDSLTMSVLVVRDDSPLRTTAVDAADDAEKAVAALRRLATNLVLAAGGNVGGSAERAGERGYALLDRAFREWLAALGPDSDPLNARRSWQRLVRRAVARLGRGLVDAAGPSAWAGRPVTGRDGKTSHYSSYQAEAWFRSALAKALPLANDPTPPGEERE